MRANASVHTAVSPLAVPFRDQRLGKEDPERPGDDECRDLEDAVREDGGSNKEGACGPC